ncbi:Crp/Fnr family transcriptional regulator [Mucilaginibacter defluvii]|uniref:Cyclic nucleotide-binding domain-containing protein n=1 Tax=Mucilaginibacter defluvii TaxID=1196019 RepID=A0ABP9FRA9_9SPHI|nr:Crp/Fnr family transcriptional regulator [Bacteroidota bacterium]
MQGGLLITFLEGWAALSPEFITALNASVRREHYQPRQVIHTAGRLEDRFWFLESGLARKYYFDPEGKEQTTRFYVSDDLIFSYKGYWKEESEDYLEVLAASTLLSVTYSALQELADTFEVTRALIRSAAKRQYQQDVFRNRLMLRTAEDRYLGLRLARPDVFRYFSVRLIATYLNMTRENLSRLMARDHS